MRARQNAERPLQIVYLDHAKVDAVVADETTGDRLGRPWIALAFDAFTRMVTGFCLTMAPPSRISAGLCLQHSICDKADWLGHRSLDAPWPIAGLPETLVSDADGFYGLRDFTRACREQGVATHWTAPGEQKYGLYIELMIGARLGAVSLSSDGYVDEFTRREDGRRPGSAPTRTLRELERHIAAEIAGDYHLERHDALRRAPIDAWKEHEPDTPFRAPRDCMRFRLSFLPEQQCGLGAEGVHILGQTFWSRSLGSDFEAGVENVRVKFDPRDLARVFVRRPAGRYVVARNTMRPHSSSERDAGARSRSDASPLDEDATHACARKCRSACPFAALASAS